MTSPDPEAARSAARIIESLADGETHHELTEAVRDAVARLHDVRAEAGGKPKAKLVLTLDLVLDGDSIDVTGEVKATLPKVKRKRTVFYATPDNLLTRRNPRQAELPLRTVATGPADAPRTAAGGGGVRTL